MLYRQCCDSDDYFTEGVYETAEDEEQDCSKMKESDEAQECHDLLTDVSQAAKFADPEGGIEVDVLDEVPPDEPDLPDLGQLLSITGDSAPDEPFGTEQKSPQRPHKSSVPPALKDFLPETLREAFNLPGDIWNSLVRLAINLRNSHGGLDVGFLKNAKSCRRAAKGLNWWQQLGSAWFSVIFFCYKMFVLEAMFTKKEGLLMKLYFYIQHHTAIQKDTY